MTLCKESILGLALLAVLGEYTVYQIGKSLGYSSAIADARNEASYINHVAGGYQSLKEKIEDEREALSHTKKVEEYVRIAQQLATHEVLQLDAGANGKKQSIDDVISTMKRLGDEIRAAYLRFNPRQADNAIPTPLRSLPSACVGYIHFKDEITAQFRAPSFHEARRRSPITSNLTRSLAYCERPQGSLIGE